MSDQFILKTVVSGAVANAIGEIKPLLIQCEAIYPPSQPLADLHAALAKHVAIADDLLGTGTMHQDGGGTDKGDGG